MGGVCNAIVEKVKGNRNPPAFEDGFGGDGDEIDFDSMFDNDGSGESAGFEGLGSSGGSFGGGSFGGDSFGGGGFGGSNFGGGAFGGNSFGGGFNSPFGQQTQQQQQKPQIDVFDTSIEKTKEASIAFVHVFRDLITSVKSKKANDWGKYFKTLTIVGGALAIGGFLFGIIGTASGIAKISFKGVPLEILLAGAVLLAGAIPGMSWAAVANVNKKHHTTTIPPKVMRPVHPPVETPAFDNFDSEFDDSDFGEWDEESYGTEDDTEIDVGDVLSGMQTTPEPPKEVDFDTALSNVHENPIMTRGYLVDTFKTFFSTCTPNYNMRNKIEEGTPDFEQLEAICIKALAAVAKKDVSELDSIRLVEAYETYFAYELKVTRHKTITKVDDIAREIGIYARQSPDDNGVSATVELFSDYYVITIYRGVKALVTIGDILADQRNVDYFKDEKHQLPYIVGIKSDGNTILTDAKNIESMLIVGRPRFGKSWFVTNIIANLCLFNSPEDVQFVIIDPKKTSMFRTISLLPHVAGFHDDSNVLDILRDIISLEAERRKKLLLDNGCDTIWALRKKGIKIPVLYVFIDEVIAVKEQFDKDAKAIFDGYTKTIITKLPYLGIRLVMIAHRAQGTIDKTTRENMNFKVAVGAENDVILEALSLKKFNTALETPGEAALSMDGYRGTYIRGNAITTSDEGNVKLFRSVAKAFYKMGFDTVDCSHLGCAYNRDEKAIQKEFASEMGNHVQMDFDKPEATNVIHN